MDTVCNTTWGLINIVLSLVFLSFFWGITPWIIFALVAAPIALALLVLAFFEAGFGICIPTKIISFFRRN